MADLEKFLAFNRQLVALQRAGIPVQTGISGDNSEAKFEQINAVIAAHVERGDTLDEALNKCANVVSPTYAAMVRAGLRCQDLSCAFAKLCEHDQTLLEVHRLILRALVYPALLSGLALVLLAVFCSYGVPVFQDTMETFRLSPPESLQLLTWLGDWMAIWISVPVVLFVATLSHRMLGASQSAVSVVHGRTLLSQLPGVKRIASDIGCAKFSDIMALLSASEKPSHDDILLAAQASGDPQLVAAAADTQIRSESRVPRHAFPPLLAWALRTDRERPSLVTLWSNIANGYQQRANHRLRWYRFVLPAIACVCIGGTIVLLYCLAVFLPAVNLLMDLA